MRGQLWTRTRLYRYNFLPLKTCLDECDREGPVIPVQNQIESSEEAKCVLTRARHFKGDDSIPKRIERGNCVDIVPRVRSEVEVVEG